MLGVKNVFMFIGSDMPLGDFLFFAKMTKEKKSLTHSFLLIPLPNFHFFIFF